MLRHAYAFCAIAAILSGCGSPLVPSRPDLSGVVRNDDTGASLPALRRAGECPRPPRVIYFFTERREGYWPHGFWPGNLVAYNGALYGATAFGGRYGLGTVFEVSRTGTQRVLYSFKGSPDGNGPSIGTGLVNVGGKFYGVTTGGGLSGAGTVFEITPSGTERVLHSFAGGLDGAVPEATLAVMGGRLYGTTFYGGGRDQYGTVFEISTSGAERVIHRFRSDDGGFPLGLTVLGSKLYGTTTAGGSGNGIVFEVTPSRAFAVLHEFTYSDGIPAGSLTAFRGALYGGDKGSVFEIRPPNQFHVVARARDIGGDGPTGELTVFGAALYGVTRYGGANKDGNVFTVAPSGSAHMLCSFRRPDGKTPTTLVPIAGKFYGAMAQGGQQGQDEGSIFETLP